MVTYGMNMLLWTTDTCGDAFLPLFGRLRKMGFDAVEIPIFDTNVEKFAALGKELDRLGLARTAVTVISGDNSVISPDPAVRAKGVAHLKAAIDCCKAAGATKLVGPIYGPLGVFSGQGPTKDEWAWSVGCMREAAEYGRQKGVVLVAEFLNRFEIYLLNCAADAARFAREVNHPNFRMMYDTFHANIEEKDIAAAVDSCKDVLVHVHISENDRSTPGKGQVKWKETFDALRKAKFQGSLVIEAFGLALPALAAATKIWRRMFGDEETLAREGLAFMKKMWEGGGAAGKKAAPAKRAPAKKKGRRK
jgi:D-psicose/D-tagatose/L-ribulose 3-epimerase